MKYQLTSISLFLLGVMGALPSPAQQIVQGDSAQTAENARISAKAAYIKGLEAFENEQYRQARELLESAYPQLNTSGGVNFALADIYFQLGEMASAAQYANQAISIEADNKWYRLKLADIYQSGGQTADAIRQLEAAAGHHPNDTHILNRLAAVYANEGMLAEATAQYTKLIQLDGPNIALRMQKLKLFSLMDRPDSLAAELEKISRLNPQQAQILEQLSNYYEQAGNNRQARTMLQKAGLNQPNDITNLKMRAEIFLSQSRWDSLQTLGAAVMNNSNLPAAQKVEFLHPVFEQFEQASPPVPPPAVITEMINALLQAHPDFIPARLLAAEFFTATNQTKKALAQLAKINASAPENKNAWIQRLHLLLNEKNYNTALQVGLQADKHHPQQPLVYYAIGRAQLAGGNTGSALQRLRQAADLPARSPLKADIFVALGNTYFELERWQNAFDALKNALNYGKKEADLLEQMGDAMNKLNKAEEARQWWQKALQQNPDNRRIQEKLNQ